MDLLQRQREYDALVEFFGAKDAPAEWRQGQEARDLHARIVRILDGKEPDPRKLR